MFEGLKRQIRETKVLLEDFTHSCPKCGHALKLPGGKSSVLKKAVICPGCQRSIPYGELLRTKYDPASFPARSFPQPPVVRIEKLTVSENEFVYSIPASGNGGVMLFLGALFTGGAALFTLNLLFTGAFKSFTSKDWAFCLSLLAVFWTAGLGMLFAGLQRKYAKHLLYLGSDQIRLNRELFGRTTKHSLPITEDIRVSKHVFYIQEDDATETNEPVYEIEIRSGKKQHIRFGSALNDIEKDWLCAEIQEHVRCRA